MLHGNEKGDVLSLIQGFVICALYLLVVSIVLVGLSVLGITFVKGLLATLLLARQRGPRHGLAGCLNMSWYVCIPE
jgi:hypothetical protein